LFVVRSGVRWIDEFDEVCVVDVLGVIDEQGFEGLN